MKGFSLLETGSDQNTYRKKIEIFKLRLRSISYIIFLQVANYVGTLTVSEIFDVVADQDYIERIRQVIFHLYKSDAHHVESIPVEEIFNGRVVWKGVVEVFTLTGHPKAKRCFAWSHSDGKGDTDERFVTVLEIPPVISPEPLLK